MQTVRVAIAPAHSEDAAAIAKLHAESWRRHYRGAYSDHYLDSELDAERLAVWTKRLARSDGDTVTLIARHENQPVGFVHAQFDADPVWGTLIDNLHVTRGLQRMKVGSRLLDAAARRVIEQRSEQAVYLWVLQQNRSAQAFYLSRGGQICGRKLVSPPGGDPRNLDGTPAGLRVAWKHPTTLLLAA
jgi:ribosomal protein S18 acetylase RimI-like enzyme